MTMTSSTPSLPQQGRDCIVSLALNDAREELDNALKKILSNEPKKEGNELMAASATNATFHQENEQETPSDDPDDMAAAFFAKQAKPPSLQCDDWAQVLLYKRNTIMESLSSGSDDGCNKTIGMEQRVDDLYETFQQAITEDA